MQKFTHLNPDTVDPFEVKLATEAQIQNISLKKRKQIMFLKCENYKSYTDLRKTISQEFNSEE